MAIVLIGESASGKTTIEREIERQGFNRVISFTTRPIRDGEENGVDYYFSSESQFDQRKARGEFAEATKYRGWQYGITKKSIRNDSVIVVEQTGLRQLLLIPDLNIVAFHITVPMRERMIRMLKRGDDIMELVRRAFSDQGAFHGIESIIDETIKNEADNTPANNTATANFIIDLYNLCIKSRNTRKNTLDKKGI